MTRDQARNIYKEIKSLYPNFNKDNEKEMVVLWLDRLEYGDYEKTKQKLFDYSMESPFPPTLADIVVKLHKPKDDRMAEQIKSAEERVSQEKSDPEKAKEREQLLQAMKQKLGAYYGS